VSAATRRRLVAGGLGLAALVVIVLAWKAVTWQSSATGRGREGASLSGPDLGVTIYPVGARPTAPAVEGRSLDGKRLDLADLRGQVVVINVWGSWCSPCRAEAPALVRASRELRTSGVTFIGVDTRDSLGAAKAFTRRYGIEYPSFDDRAGAVLVRFSELVPIGAIPSTLVIDPQGQVSGRVIGKVDYTTLRGLIDDTLSTSTPRATAQDKP